MNNIRYYRLLFFLLITCFKSYGQEINWTEVLPGVWKGVVGKPESYNLLTAAGVTPRSEAIRKLSNTSFPFVMADVYGGTVDGKTYLRFPLDSLEQLFGFGLHFQSVHQRGKILRLHVDHYGGVDNGRTHAPTPFYVSSNGYGVFINSARYLDVYAGSAVRKDSKHPPQAKDRNVDKTWTARPYSDAVEILVPAVGVEFYVFGGPTPLDAVRRFNLFNGGGVLPPRWGLGFTQRVQRLYNAEEVEEEVKAFEQRGYPLDFVGLEPGWQSKSYPCTFEWDPKRFPNPEALVQRLLKKGVRINLWTNPYVSPASPIFKEIKPFTSSHTVWVGLVPDLMMAQARNTLFSQWQRSQVDIGISGYKIDEVDGGDHYLWPDVASFPSGYAAEQMRQTYGVLMQRYSTGLYRKENKRTYGLIRGSNAGAVSFPYVIYNDYYKHEDFITALVNSGFAGVLWTPEVRASKSEEEWLRRFQSTIFSPMAMINAWASGTKPWSFPDVEAHVKEAALLRMRMMPYWYSEFAKYHFEGTPPFRAMNLEEGFTLGESKKVVTNDLEKNPYAEAYHREIKDQYMAGEYLLVAPMFTGQTSREVLLPKGNWYDFYTGAYVGNGETITATPGLDKIPVYVKDGGIIPFMPPLLHAPKAGEQVAIEVRHYGKKNGEYDLYEDDGESYDYENGEYSFRKIKVERGKEGNWEGWIAPPEKGKPNTIEKVTFKFMTP